MDAGKDINFPTLGEIVNEIFSAFGVFPQKNDKGHRIVNEKQKKTFQKTLQRLAKEESYIQERLDELIQLLADIVNEACGRNHIGAVTFQVVHDFLDEYRASTTFFTTFLNKKANIEWLAFYRVLPSLLSSLFCHAGRFRLYPLSVWLPEPSVFLPTYNAGTKNTALSKVWNWIYKDIKISQRSFHCLTKNNFEAPYAQNLENVQGWCSGRSLPSLHALFSNLDTSLNQHDWFSLPADGMRALGYKTALLLARISTYTFNVLEKNYGESKVQELSEFARQQVIVSAAIGKSSYDLTCQWLDRVSVKSAEAQLYYSSDFLFFLYGKKDKILNDVNPNLRGHWEKCCLEIGLNWNRLITAHNLREQAAAFDKRKPDNYERMHKLGVTLRKDSDSTLESIEDYRKQLHSFDLEPHLQWLANWCEAVYYYRKGDDESAFTFYKKAFDNSKYKIGGDHYGLVNQYVESAAKCRRWKEFTKGIAWAQYLGIKIRWHRGHDNPESPEALKFTYETLGMDKMRFYQL